MLSSTSLDAVAQLLEDRYGFRSDGSSRRRLARALRDEARRCGEMPCDHVQTLRRSTSAQQELVDAVTVQETRFFRDTAHFDALEQHILGQLPRGPLTIWSAGCANGQEAYSVAMLLAESGRSDWRIVATDVSTRALQRTRAARYGSREIAALPAWRRARHMVHDAGDWTVRSELRARVTTLHHNLASAPPPSELAGSCHVILCRHVLIYLSPDRTAATLRRFGAVLAPDGWLMIGGTETLASPAGFRLTEVGSAFLYRRLEGHGAMAAAAAGQIAAPAGVPAPLVRGQGPAATTPPPALADVPPDLSILVERALAALDAGAIAVAVRGLRQAVYLAPDHIGARVALAVALDRAGDTGAATRARRAALRALENTDCATEVPGFDGRSAADIAGMLAHSIAQAGAR